MIFRRMTLPILFLSTLFWYSCNKTYHDYNANVERLVELSVNNSAWEIDTLILTRNNETPPSEFMVGLTLDILDKSDPYPRRFQASFFIDPAIGIGRITSELSEYGQVTAVNIIEVESSILTYSLVENSAVPPIFQVENYDDSRRLLSGILSANLVEENDPSRTRSLRLTLENVKY